MEQVVALAAITFFAGKCIEFLKYLRARDINGALTLISVMVAGVAAIFLGAASSVTKTLVIPGTAQALGDMNGAGKLFVGLVLTSLTSVVYDFKKAFDGNDSAKQPPLTTAAHGENP